MRNFDFWNHEYSRFLHHRVRTLNLVFSDLVQKFRKSRNIKIEVTVTVTNGVSGPHTFRGGYSAVTISVTVTVTVIVTPFVSTKSLSSGKGFMTDGTLVGPTNGIGGARSSGGGGSGLVVAAARAGGGGEFPVTSFVSAECLVRREAFVANGAFVSVFGRRVWWRSGATVVNGGGGGGGATASEHDETKSEVLFLRNVVA